jgi:hypothetical protein
MRRRFAVAKFFGWLLVTGVVAFLVHPALLLVGVVIGAFVLDPGVFSTYKRSRKDRAWAENVLAETGAQLEES